MERSRRRSRTPSSNKPLYRKRRAAIACQVCRSRKSKCDGATPQCGFCESVGADCNYEALSDGGKERDESSTQQRLAALEESVRRLNEVVSSTGQTPTDRTFQHTPEMSRQHFSVDDEVPSRRQMDIITNNIGFDITSYLTDLESEISLVPSASQASIVFDTGLVTAFFDHVYQWYPIFNKQSFEREYLHASLPDSTLSSLCLLVCAIGALAMHLKGGADDCSMVYASKASRMLHVVVSDTTLLGVQCLILYSIYYSLRFKPVLAQEYVTMASHKIQNLYKRDREQTTVKTEQYRRAFYALFIMEREHLVQLRLTPSGIQTLEEQVPLPSGAFEDGTTDGATTTFFLAEIAMQKILEQTDQNWPRAIYQASDFRTLIAEEIDSQLVEWRSHLPSIIAFSDTAICRNDLSLFLKMQYACTMCGIRWHTLQKVINMEDTRPEVYSEGQKCILSFCSFIDAASDFFSKPVTIPHVSMTLAAVFTMSLAMTCVRKQDISHDIIHIEDTFVRAVKILSGYGTIYPATTHWAEILEERLS